MRDFAIISDSCCDLDAGLRARFGIDYIPMRIIYGENDIPASLDWEQISSKEFYDLMRQGGAYAPLRSTPTSSKRCFQRYSRAVET